MTNLKTWTGIILIIGAGLTLLGFLSTCNKRMVSYQDKEVTKIQHKTFDELLGKYVNDAGNVNYEAWKQSEEDMDALNNYLSKMTSVTPDTHPDLFSSDEDRMAYWINLYNALVIDTVLDHYPLDSVRDIEISLASRVVEGLGFFSDYQFKVGSKKRSLNDIEHGILRERYKDPRIHFVVNCASTSCPPLIPEAYTGEKLFQKMEKQTRKFLNDPDQYRINEDQQNIYLSRILDWYREDFTSYLKNEKEIESPDVLDYVLLYAEESIQKKVKKARDENYTIKFLDYDWSLNDVEDRSSNEKKK